MTKFAATLPLCTLPMCMLIAGCSQSDAPSEKMGAAAEELVEAVLETPAPDAEPVVEDEAVTLGQYAPRDGCADLDGAEPFLAALGAAIEMRDTDLLIALSADDVKLGFGGEDGADFMRIALDAEGPNLWPHLEDVMTMGCAANSQGGITMPYYFSQDMQIDPFEAMMVTGDNVPLLATAGSDAQVLATVSWEEVQLAPDAQGTVTFGGDPEDVDQGWTRVRLQATEDRIALEGFIAVQDLRSVIDYRLIAASRNGRWRITAFLAGD